MVEFEYRQKIAKAVSPELPPEQVLYSARGQGGDFQLNPVLLELNKNRNLPLATVLIGGGSSGGSRPQRRAASPLCTCARSPRSAREARRSRAARRLTRE